jgi:hypothetical protein
VTFERTFDYELVRRIITHPKVYRWMVSDDVELGHCLSAYIQV